MSKILILIGAGYNENKFSASLIVGNHRDDEIDICEVSKARVHIRLNEFLNNDYSKLYLVGTSINHNHIEILKVLKKYKTKGCDSVWISAFSCKGEQEEIEFNKYIELFYPEQHTCIFEMTRRYLKVNKGDALFKNLEKVINKPSDKDKQVNDLIDAVSSRYRRFQDMETLSRIIKDLSNYKTALWRDEYLDEKRAFIDEYYRFGSREIHGKSKRTIELKELIKKIGKNNNCNVLITGETGTGKETIANLIHGYSNRNDNYFIPFNCADLSPQLIESKLFGHIKGAFTGADKDTAGAFELANGGTLFLDELTELSLEVQAGLLRVIQERRFKKLGAEKELEVDIRIIGATNKNIFEQIKKGKFREDLYYRLSSIELDSIPLRENKEDIGHIAKSYNIDKGYPQLDEKQLEVLRGEYDWPGNVRELQNIIDRANILGNHDYSQILNNYKSRRCLETKSELLSDIARNHAIAMLAKYKGNQTHAAKAMGIALNTFKNHLK